MKLDSLNVSKIAGLGLGAIAGLSLLILPGPSSTAFAAQDTAASNLVAVQPILPDGAQILEGSYVNLPAERTCSQVGATPVCTYQIQGKAETADGEPYRHKIFGTTHGVANAPGDEAHNRSYVIWSFDDGSNLLLKSESVTTVGDDGEMRLGGNQVCVEGTGRFADMDCTIDWANERGDDGLMVGTYKGTMTPKASVQESGLPQPRG